MNILFTTENNVSPYNGGTDRITDTLCQSFRRFGHNVLLSYVKPDGAGIENPHFCAIYHWDLSDKTYASVEQTIADNSIDYVICNYVSFSVKKKMMPMLLSISHTYGAKVFFCFHAMPGEDIIGARIDNILYRLTHHYDQKQACKDIILGIIPDIVLNRYLKPKYQFYYNNCDRLVLLSRSFFEPFAKLAGIAVNDKFTAIPNALTFPTVQDISIREKKKEVLIVSRLHERSKRLSHALKIWKKVEESGRFDDWTLNIVGGGIDENYYKCMSLSLKLSNVVFWGRQESLELFYRRASIFMMTSAFEGFGITLTEAQQFGAVPIAYDSFASISDIIKDGYNGMIVGNGRINDFSMKMMELMDDEESREEYSKNSISHVQRFSQEIITENWLNLLNKE